MTLFELLESMHQKAGTIMIVMRQFARRLLYAPVQNELDFSDNQRFQMLPTRH